MQRHGLYEIIVEDNLLVSHFFGAWNYEQTKLYQKQVKIAAASLLDKPWARVVDLSHWEGGGEEILTPLRDLQNWSNLHNCKVIVFVNPPLLPAFMLKKHGDIYGHYKIVGTVLEAKLWAISQIELSL